MVADRIRKGLPKELDKLADAVLAGAMLPADAAKTLMDALKVAAASALRGDCAR